MGHAFAGGNNDGTEDDSNVRTADPTTRHAVASSRQQQQTGRNRHRHQVAQGSLPDSTRDQPRLDDSETPRQRLLWDDNSGTSGRRGPEPLEGFFFWQASAGLPTAVALRRRSSRRAATPRDPCRRRMSGNGPQSPGSHDLTGAPGIRRMLADGALTGTRHPMDQMT